MNKENKIHREKKNTILTLKNSSNFEKNSKKN